MAHCRRNSSCLGDCVCGCNICSPEAERKAERQQISSDAQDAAIEHLKEELERRLRQKGRGTFASTHEAYGIIAEEFIELGLALQANDMQRFLKECDDIAVACSFARACASENGLQW